MTGRSQSQKARGREAAEGMTNAFFNCVYNTTSFPVHTPTVCLMALHFLTIVHWKLVKVVSSDAWRELTVEMVNAEDNDY